MAGAIEMAAEEVNATGGLEVAGKKHKVTVIRYDDKSKPSDAVTGMNRLIYEDRAKYVYTFSSASQLAVAQTATDNKVITIVQAYAAKALDKAYPYAFRTVITTNEFAGPQTKWLAQKLKARRVGVLFPNNESGQQIAADFAKAYGAAGGPVVQEFFEGDRVDFAPLLTRLMEKKIDAIDLDGNSPTTAGLILKQARELGFKGPVVRTGGESTQDIIDVAGKTASEGLYVHLPADFNDPPVAAFKQQFDQKYKVALSAAAVPTYVSTKLLLAAIQKAGSAENTEAVGRALEQVRDAPSMLGPVNWITPKDLAGNPYGTRHQILTRFYIGQVRAGKVAVVATCDLQSCS